ncbi:hypothetical protein V8F33_008857 [Rhypophila sp. PSN 637]
MAARLNGDNITEPDGSEVSRPPFGPLQYDPLPSPTSIRLLEILPTPDVEMRCCLVTVELIDESVFDALSYPWGDPITIREKPDDWRDVETAVESVNIAGQSSRQCMAIDKDVMMYRIQHPFTPYEKVDWNAERKHAVICNGNMVVMVTENLMNALVALKRWRCDPVSLSGPGDFKPLLGHSMPRYIWVDMICINQDDIDERNAQQSALTVIGWMGQETSDTCFAFATMGYMTSSDLNISSTDGNTKSIPPRDLYALFCLFQRLWFSRAWIVQELALAKNLILCCGHHFIPWHLLMWTVARLGDLNWYDAVSGVRPRPHQRRPLWQSQASFLKDRRCDRGPPSNLPSASMLRFYPRDHRGTQVSSSGHEYQGRNSDDDGNGETMPQRLLVLLQAKLSHQPGLVPQNGIGHAAGVPKTRYTCPSSRPLPDRGAGLPSYVPDFNVSLGADLFNTPLPGFCPYSAAGKGSHIHELHFSTTKTIQVSGVRVDAIAEAASTNGCYFIRTARVVLGLPPPYSTIIPATPASPTRAEAYWRTLIGDVVDGKHPAIPEVGFEFSDWIAEEVVLSEVYLWKRDNQRSGPAEGAQSFQPPAADLEESYKNMSEKIRCWQELEKDDCIEAGGGEFVRLGSDELRAAAGRRMEEEEQGDDANGGLGEKRKKNKIRYIPDQHFFRSGWKKHVPKRPHAFEVEGEFLADVDISAFGTRLAEVKRGHRIFRTANGFLGMGPLSSEIGDEVWVLEGGKTPFVVRRPREGGSRCRLIGEAYVHGIMHGEAICPTGESGFGFEQTFLVLE